MKLNRAIVRVEWVGHYVIEATIIQCVHLNRVSILMSLIPRGIPVSAGTRLIADVNLDARRSSELGITNIELAPPPDPDDGLAPPQGEQCG